MDVACLAPEPVVLPYQHLAAESDTTYAAVLFAFDLAPGSAYFTLSILYALFFGQNTFIMKINRTTATHIMSKAVDMQELCLLAVMDKNDTVFYADSVKSLNRLIQTHPDAIWLYNQNPDAIDSMEQLSYPDGQQSIEIFQDTEGVFGLRAYQQTGNMQTPVTLELNDLEE